jgi:uncharacterized protein
MNARVGDWMITASGRRFWPLDPREADVDFHDIAHHLSQLVRYGGAGAPFYSVAEHSVLLALHMKKITRDPALGRRLALWALLHDASEAYFADVIRPVKRFVPALGVIELALDRCIWMRAGLLRSGDAVAMPTDVKAADVAIVGDEVRALFGEAKLAAAGWTSLPDGIGTEIQGWQPKVAELHFKAALFDLAPDLLGSGVPT